MHNLDALTVVESSLLTDPYQEKYLIPTQNHSYM